MKKLLFIAFCFTIFNTIIAQKKDVIKYEGKEIEVLKTGLRTSDGLKGKEYKYSFKGINSSTIIKKTTVIEFILLKDSILINPEKDVRIVKFDVNKKRRTTRTFIPGPLNQGEAESPKLVSGGTVQMVNDSTYKITVSNLEIGEYAIVLGDVNFVENKVLYDSSISFHCFSIIE